MLKPRFTPGPWGVSASDADDAGPTVAFQPFNGCGCCNSPWIVGETREERNANARLIAAAPDLYTALEEITLDYADRFDLDDPSTNPGIKAVIEQARAALAAARGSR